MPCMSIERIMDAHPDRGARGWTYAVEMHEMTFSRQPTLCLLHVDDAAHPQMPAG